MAKVVRKGDATTGHSCYAPTILAEGSDWIKDTGIPVVHIGHAIVPHSCPSSPPHGGIQSTGSSFVFIDGKAVARIGDSISCGDFNAGGSSWIDIDS